MTSKTTIATLPLLGTLTAVEWHGFVLGLVAGYYGRGDETLDVVYGERDPRSPAESQMHREGWYPAAGVLVGVWLRGGD